MWRDSLKGPGISVKVLGYEGVDGIQVAPDTEVADVWTLGSTCSSF
jgi:hypothetical protein